MQVNITTNQDHVNINEHVRRVVIPVPGGHNIVIEDLEADIAITIEWQSGIPEVIESFLKGA